MTSVNKIQQAEITELVSPREVWIKMGDWTGIVACNPDYMPRAVGDICWVRIDDAFPGPPHICVLDKVRPESDHDEPAPDEPLARRLSRLGSSGHVKVGAEQPDPDDLAKAERAWRWRAEHPRGINMSTGQKVQLRMLLAEYDRRGKVEQAASEYMLSCLCNGGTDSPELNADINTKFGALLDAVRTNGEFRG